MFALRSRSRHIQAHRPWCFLAIFLVTSIAPLQLARSRTWHIQSDGTGDAPTIQAGVDSASVGDTVLVAAGAFVDTHPVLIDGALRDVNVFMSKAISLISENGPSQTSIGSSASDVAIYVDGVGLGGEISGFRIQTSFSGYDCLSARSTTAAPSFLTGIKCRFSSLRITNNEIIGNEYGIELSHSPAVISANSISQAYYGIGCHAGSDAEISNNFVTVCGSLLYSDGSAPRIIDNDLSNACSAIVCTSGSGPIIAGNRISDTSPVAVDCGRSSVTILDNQFTNSNLAVRLNVMEGTTVVRGNIFYSQVSGALSLSDNPNATIIIENNSIDLTTLGYAIFCQRASSPTIRQNIIVRSVGGVSCIANSLPVIECNDVFVPMGTGYGGSCSDQTGVNGNISADPQFCGLPESNNYYLQGDSPCAPGNHPNGFNCGQIGALDASCGTVETKPMTWGAIKALYGGGKK